MSNSRRDFLKTSALLALAGVAGDMIARTENLIPVNGDEKKLELAPLPYGFDAMEPFIDKETMKIHYAKHHQGYVDKLNTAGKEFNREISLEESCARITESSASLVRNNLGGHYNHSVFWQLLQPASKKGGSAEGSLAEKIKTDFGGFDKFKSEFSEKAAKHFGSGWCWLIADDNNNLRITTTPNQDNPLMQVSAERGRIILGLDVWEHAYYLKYQNKRADYIEAWWNLVNWNKAGQLFKK